jgi:regulator of microtubule dynamics protein 3
MRKNEVTSWALPRLSILLICYEKADRMKNRRMVMAAVALLCTIILSPLASYSSIAEENSEVLMARALQLRDGNREAEALPLFEAVLREAPGNYQALLNAAFIHFRLGWLYSDQKEEKDHYMKMQGYARRALNQRPMEYQAKLMCLVAKAKTAGYLSPRQQVRIAKELQQELEALMASNKNDPDTLYFLSWLNYKVGKLGSLEKMLASVFFGGLPENLTIENAVELMQKAIELRPDYSIYYFDLGLFEQRLGQREKARSLFEKVLSMAPRKSEELVYRKWAERKLSELSEHNTASN